MKDNGGPAFPCEVMTGGIVTDASGINRYATEPMPGMTLRDYFAAKAMQGLLAQSCGVAMLSDPKADAKYAYDMADAMIAERAK